MAQVKQMKEIPELEELRPIIDACACLTLRKAARATTQLYDRCLQSSGLTATQFSLLVRLHLKGPMTMTKLADRLLTDRTTLTRNVELLVEAGLVEITHGTDRRTRLVSLSPAGERAIRQALPLWRKAQQRMIGGLGSREWQSLRHSLRDAIAAAK
jgi:DNA-binding MarR family transcriptional regulator